MPRNLWNDTEAQALPDFEGLVYRSNLLGQDRSVVNIYGGNTSSKLKLADHRGREVEVLAVKASGSDVRTIQTSGFSLLRLDDIKALLPLEVMSDEEMVAYLERTVFEPGRPRQSIETLLHAFLPFKHIDHTHPDAVISIACSPDAEKVTHEVYGMRAAYVPYVRPGFALSKWIATKVNESSSVECVVLGKHGLVTWGSDSKASYAKAIDIIQEAEDFVSERMSGKRVFGELQVPGLKETDRKAIMAEILPLIRGAVSKQCHMVLQYDGSDEVLTMVGSSRTEQVTQIGAACPDHLIHVKRQPLYVAWQPDQGTEALKSLLSKSIETYKDGYRAYFEANKKSGDEMRDPAPRVILIPGLGMVNTGKDITNARVSQQLYHRAVAVLGGAEAIGGFNSLTANEAYNVEYWPLESYKLKLAPPEREFAGKVVLITGGAAGIGRAAAYRFAREGSHVVIADINTADGQAVADDLQASYGDGTAMFVRADATCEGDVVEAIRSTVLKYGGLDVLVNNAGVVESAPVDEMSIQRWQRQVDVLLTGYFLFAREAFKVMKAQGIGGAIVFVSSKNGVVPGKNVSAYSAAKAAELHLARCLAEEGGPFGIRVNSVLPDAVIEGSAMWSPVWKEERAAQYGIKPEDLDDYYRNRNALKTAIFAEDQAEAIAFLAGPRSAKTTGAMLTVDGGVPGAYAR